MSSVNEDRTVGMIPAEGPNDRKANFFREVASAFEFLALFYSLSAKDQAELMAAVQQFSAATTRAANAARNQKERK